MTPPKTQFSDTAMVLAAGLGTRMRHLTQDRPKALIEVCETPLIDGVLDRLAAAGVSKAVVNVHHHAAPLREHLEARQQPQISISDETDQLLDTGGGVARALDQLGEKPFVVVNGDVLWLDGREGTLTRLAERWIDDDMDALLLMCFTVNAIGYEGMGDFMMSDDGRLVRREEQCVSPFVFTGIQVLHPRLFENAPNGVFSLNRLYDQAEANGKLFGLIHEGAWMHVGTPEGVTAAEDVLNGL